MPLSAGAVISTPTPVSTEEIISTDTPVPAGAVVAPPTPVSTDDCLNDPLNAAGCMDTPIIKQGLTAVISVGATLATILVTLLGSAATSAGGAVAEQ